MQKLQEKITNDIISSLECGVKPWVNPWDYKAKQRLPFNLASNSKYTGINTILLWMRARARNYSNNGWLTLRQANRLGGHVRSGEYGARCIYYNIAEIKGRDKTVRRAFMSTFDVFNEDQVENLEQSSRQLNCESVINIERLLSVVDIDSNFTGDDVYDSPSRDVIRMPNVSALQSNDEYCVMLLRKMICWTGDKARLNRSKDYTRFGDEADAFSELVIDIGSAFLGADLGVTSKFHDDSYLESWLKLLQGDKKTIFRAASLASKAHHYLMSLASGDYTVSDLQIAY